ncbi:MAG: hypothetical protein QW587_04575 [Candidatus Bathyarchaeia archaeon]
MVHCLKCLQRLPDLCTCPVSPRAKKRRFINAAMRELKLIEAITFKGYKPKVRFGRETVYPKVTETPYGVKLEVNITPKKPPKSWRHWHGTYLVLLDTEEKPLYRQTAVSMNLLAVQLDPGETLTMTWKLGWGNSMW